MAKQIDMVIESADFDSSGITICTIPGDYKPELEKHGWARSSGTPIVDWGQIVHQELGKEQG
jgi:hypothetical protein